MNGTDAVTGKQLSGLEHLKQSIRDILSTPIGSRVMRRDYGSRVADLVDGPINASTIVAIYSAVAEALRRWEPRFKLRRVQVASVAPGQVVIDLEGTYLADGKPITLEGIEL